MYVAKCPPAEPDRAKHQLGSTGTAGEVDSVSHAYRARVDPVEGRGGRGAHPDIAEARGEPVDRRGTWEANSVRDPSGGSVDAQQLVVNGAVNGDPDGAEADCDRARLTW